MSYLALLGIDIINFICFSSLAVNFNCIFLFWINLVATSSGKQTDSKDLFFFLILFANCRCAPGYTRLRSRARVDEGRICEPIGHVEETNIVFVPTPEGNRIYANDFLADSVTACSEIVVIIFCTNHIIEQISSVFPKFQVFK